MHNWDCTSALYARMCHAGHTVIKTGRLICSYICISVLRQHKIFKSMAMFSKIYSACLWSTCSFIAWVNFPFYWPFVTSDFPLQKVRKRIFDKTEFWRVFQFVSLQSSLLVFNTPWRSCDVLGLTSSPFPFSLSPFPGITTLRTDWPGKEWLVLRQEWLKC